MAQSRNYSYGISLSSKLASIAGNVEIGRALVFSDVDDGFVIATAANRAALGNRSTYGIALTPGNSTQPLLAPPVVEMLAEGLLVKEISALGPGAKCFVRVNDNGWLERVVSPAPSDDVIGTCETNGDVHVRCGGFAVSSTLVTLGAPLQLLRTNAGATATEWWTLSVDLASSTVTNVLPLAKVGCPTGTGWSHVTSGAWDAAARAIDLSTGDTINNLALARVTAPTGTGLAKVTGGNWNAAASLLVDADVSATADIQITKLLKANADGKVAMRSAGASTWDYVANANIASGAAIDTAKLALPGSASEVFYRGAGPVIAAAAKTSVAADGSLQVGAANWATIGGIRHAYNSSEYARNNANTADLCVWHTSNLARGNTLYLGTSAPPTAAKTFDVVAINAKDYLEFGVSDDPSVTHPTYPYLFCDLNNLGVHVYGNVAYEGVAATASWGGGGAATIFVGDTPTVPTTGATYGSVLWSSATALKHVSSGGIINQLSHGQARIGITHTTAARTLTAAEVTPLEITFFLVTGVLDGACTLTWPTPSSDVDAYTRIVFYDAVAHQPNITHQLASGATVTQKPGSSIIMTVDTTYGIRLSSGLGGVSVSGAATYTAAAGTSTEFQVNDGFGVLAAASNVLYVAGKLQTATNLQWLNGLIKGDLAWAPTSVDKMLTLPNATDTLVGKATTDVLTNKTLDTAGAGNSLLINGVAATDNTGTGKVVRDTSPTLVTPAITTSATISRNGIANASSVGLLLQNVTPATAIATLQYPPRIQFDGQAWLTTSLASATTSFILENQVAVGGTLPHGTFRIAASIGGSGYSDRFTLTDVGVCAIGGATTVAGAIQATNAALTSARSALAATSTDGFAATNSTAAAAAAQQWSPRVRWTGAGWKTDATAGSQVVDWIAEVQPVQGTANPSANFVLASQINAGGYTARLTLQSDGSIVATGTITGLTFDTAGSGNVLKINGTAVSDKTGTGKVVLDTSPTLTTPAITTSAVVTNNALTTTDAEGIAVQNTTAATSGAAQQNSPIVRISGTIWNGASSDAVDYALRTGRNSTTAPLFIKERLNGGSYGTVAALDGTGSVLFQLAKSSGGVPGAGGNCFVMDSSGNITTIGAITSPALAGTPTVTATTEITWTGDTKGTRRQRALAHAQSTSATRVTIDTITVPTSAGQLLHITVAGIKSDLTASYGYTLDIVAKNNAGTVTWGSGTSNTVTLGSVTNTQVPVNAPQVSISGTTIQILSGGTAATTIQWTSSVELIEVIS